MILAKSNGLSLYKHSKIVEKLAIKLSYALLKDSVLKEHLSKIKKASLLHDIAKCCEQYQQYYLKGKLQSQDSEESNERLSVLHHELSWAVAMCLLDKREYEYSLNAIYWHHAKPIYEKNSKRNDFISNLLNELSDNDIKVIYENAKQLIPENLISFDKFLKNIKDYKQSSETTPRYYSSIEHGTANQFAIIYRSILISSDRIASKLNEEEIDKALFDDDYCLSILKNEKDILTPIFPEYYNPERVELQQTAVNDARENETVIIKAPGGFGKTLVGLLWSLKSTKKLLWVCPRNVVVGSVYNSILSEIESIGLKDKISVELFITGKRKECTNIDTEEFKSDIVITNIDNFLAPVSKNRFGIWSAEILQRDVVFDEFHEFITEGALFEGFLQIMKIRHNFVKCNTLLLSATTNQFSLFWDPVLNKTKILPNEKEHYPAPNKTKILPNEKEHYPAQHSKIIKIKYIKEEELKIEKNKLIITNSIYNAQLKKKKLRADLLVHSDFLEEDKKEKFDILYKNYGKNNVLNDKPSFVSAPILQASCDISFKNLAKSMLGPDSDEQSFFRCNRFGEYDDSTIEVFEIESESKSENKAISILYDSTLHSLWVKFFKQEAENYNFEMKPDDFCVVYNKFNEVYKNEIKDFNIKKRKLSLNAFSKIEPVKFNISSGKTKSSVKIQSLRTNGDSVFVTYRRHDSKDDFIPPFNLNIPENMIPSTYFKEDESFNKKFNKTIKTFIQKGQFNYPIKFKNVGVNPFEIYKKYAFKDDTPYIAFNKEYSKEYGLAKLEIYK